MTRNESGRRSAGLSKAVLGQAQGRSVRGTKGLTIGRALAGSAAVVFALIAYAYLTLPDVRRLKTSNPTTTAFMDLRAAEARARGQQPRRLQRWVAYGRVSSNLTRAVLVAEDDLFWQHE